MSKIPTLSKMDANKSIYSNRAPPSKITITSKPHKCPRTAEMAALRNRISHLEKIIEELRSRNDTREIEQLLQKNTIEHQSKLLAIIDRNISPADEEDPAEKHRHEVKLQNSALLLDIRTNFIEHLLQNEETMKNLLKEKQTTANLMRQMESALQEKDKVIGILRAVIHEKDKRLTELERIKSTCDHEGKILNQNRVNMEERISNLVTENLRHRTMHSLTRI